MKNIGFFAFLLPVIFVSGALSASELEKLEGTAGATFLNQDQRAMKAISVPMTALPGRAEPGVVLTSGAELKTAAFDVLANLFANGVMPRLQSMAGWYAGRAFADVSPNTPEGTLFAGVYAASVPGGGPLFENQLRFAVFGNWETVDKYERMTYPEANMMKNLIAEECFRLSVPLPSGTEVAVNRLVTGDGHTELYQFRINGSYLILRHTWTKKDGEVTTKRVKYAYYFRNVTPYY